MTLTIEQELRLIRFRLDIAQASEQQLRELLEMMFVADIKKVEAYNELIKKSWFK